MPFIPPQPVKGVPCVAGAIDMHQALADAFQAGKDAGAKQALIVSHCSIAGLEHHARGRRKSWLGALDGLGRWDRQRLAGCGLCRVRERRARLPAMARLAGAVCRRAGTISMFSSGTGASGTTGGRRLGTFGANPPPRA